MPFCVVRVSVYVVCNIVAPKTRKYLNLVECNPALGIVSVLIFIKSGCLACLALVAGNPV